MIQLVYWNGITLRLNDSDENQSRNEYLDIWLNTNEVKDESMILILILDILVKILIEMEFWIRKIEF